MAQVLRVAVLLSTDRQYHRGVLQGVARFARLHGPWDLESEPTHAAGQMPTSKLRNMDGVMLLVTSRRQIQLLRRWNLPVVNMSSRFPDEDLAHVSNDGTSIAKLAIEHFIERGFRHFAFCDLTDASSYRRRRLEEQLAARRLACHVFQGQLRGARRLGYGPRSACGWKNGCRSCPSRSAFSHITMSAGGTWSMPAAAWELLCPMKLRCWASTTSCRTAKCATRRLSSIVTDAERIGFEAGAAAPPIDERQAASTRCECSSRRWGLWFAKAPT